MADEVPKKCDQSTQCMPCKKRQHRRRIQTSFLCNNLSPFPLFPRGEDSVVVLWKRRTKSMLRICKSVRNFPSESYCQCHRCHHSEHNIAAQALDISPTLLPDDTTIITPAEMTDDDIRFRNSTERALPRAHEYIPWVRNIPRAPRVEAPAPSPSPQPIPAYKVYANPYVSYDSSSGSYQGYQQYPYYGYHNYNTNMYYSQPNYPVHQIPWNYTYPNYFQGYQ